MEKSGYQIKKDNIIKLNNFYKKIIKKEEENNPDSKNKKDK